MKKIISFCFLCFFILFVNGIHVHAIKDLDRILEYDISIVPNDDATLKMKYHIKWKVLDSESEGPLTWVKIGIPNKHISQIKFDDEVIKKASYYSDGGAYIAIYFKQKYYEGSIVDFSFSFVQDYFFTKDGRNIEYSFTPGWFPEIKVLSYRVSWSKKLGIPLYSNCHSEDDNKLYWEGSLDYNEKINVDVKYNGEIFKNANYNKQYSSTYISFGDIMTIVFVVLIIIGFIIIIYYASSRQYDGYYMYRGFTGRRHMFWMFRRRGYKKDGKKVSLPPNTHNGSHGGGHGGHCACACACACAGGGRAGCSRKDFTIVDTKGKSLNEN